MNTGQMMLVIGALVLLSLVAISVNSMITNKTSSMLETEANLNAVALAQSMLDEALSKSYDAATADGTKIFDSTKFTSPSGLGCSSDEAKKVPQPDTLKTVGGGSVLDPDSSFRSARFYNDVDDYHTYRRLVSTTTMGIFAIIDTVYYVRESNPNTKSTTPTFYKRIVVTVRHPNMYPPGVTYNRWSGKYCVQLSDVAVYRRYF